MSQGLSADTRKDPRGRRRPLGYDRAAPLKPIDLLTHTQLLDARKIMSGRCRGYVYWWRKGKLHFRRHVVPRDPRTPKQRRSRAAFRKASKAWSQNQPLTHAQRDAWRAFAAKIKSKPRLYTSGFLTAQQHFVGSNAIKERWGLPLLLEPPTGQRKKAECRMQNTESSAQVRQPQRLVRPTWEPRRGASGVAPERRRAAKSCTRRTNHRQVPIQVTHYQPLARPSSDRPHTPAIPLPVQCRWQPCSPGRLGSIPSPRLPSSLAQIRRNARFRELWRGG